LFFKAYKRGYFLIGIVLAAVGHGGAQVTTSPLGAQQVEWMGESAVQSFCNWFYWFYNVGGCIAYLFVIYIQQEIGFGVGYLIPAVSMLVGVFIFMLPRNCYQEHEQGLFIVLYFHVLVNLFVKVLFHTLLRILHYLLFQLSLKTGQHRT
jgi:dipeptide/tripeptide permease